LQRLDREFGIRLPEQLLADASTPSDLLAAVRAAQPAAEAVRLLPTPEIVRLPEGTEPKRARTLLEALDAHIRADGARTHIHLWVSDGEERRITYEDLHQAARRAAVGLLDTGLQAGDRVAIMLPTGADFFTTFLAVLMAGGIPVPIYPPFRRAQVEDHLRRQAGILRNAQACILVTDLEIQPLAGILMGLAEDLRSVTTVAELSRSEPLAYVAPASASTTALIQYTSGSTGDPKGVVLSHANLLANIRAMGAALEASSHDVFSSWLPLYHDMGLIGAWLGSLYYGAPLAVMPPLAFLANPARWLWSIHRHRATLSAAPNFAFELCLKSVRDDDIAGLDLGSLRMVVNGAEPVSPGTITRFAARFGRFGFRPEAMAPVYGLAECSVGLAFPPVGRQPLIDRVQRMALSRDGSAIAARPDEPTPLEFVACGRPLPGHQIRIVDEAGRELPDRRQGRLEFKGPSATSGYFRNDEKTRALFDGEWLDSGDLAYIAQGDIYVTGRIKDMIIRAGRHIFPHELEEMVGSIEGIRKGCVVAFPARDARTATERLVVMAETRLEAAPDKRRMREMIASSSLVLLDTPPDDIVLVPPHAIPKTSSGKIRRSAARAIYESGQLAEPSRALWLQVVRLEIESLLHRGRRLARRSAEFAYGAYWWALLASLGIVIWPLVTLLPDRRRRRAVVRTAGRWFLRLTGTSLRIEGDAASAARARSIIVANHASYLDGLVLSAALPGELTFIAKHEFQSQFIVGTFLKRLGAIFVHRVEPRSGVADTEAIAQAVREGATLVTFPEGTFSRMPGLLPFRLGAFFVAAQTGCPVVPVTIRGTRMVLRDIEWFPRPGPIVVHIGEALMADGTDLAAAARIRDRCRAAILDQVGEPDLEREHIDLPSDE
jgi:1-acyl-sn-glycerol-3-phosphate acyltransferase